MASVHVHYGSGSPASLDSGQSGSWDDPPARWTFQRPVGNSNGPVGDSNGPLDSNGSVESISSQETPSPARRIVNTPPPTRPRTRASVARKLYAPRNNKRRIVLSNAADRKVDRKVNRKVASKVTALSQGQQPSVTAGVGTSQPPQPTVAGQEDAISTIVRPPLEDTGMVYVKEGSVLRPMTPAEYSQLYNRPIQIPGITPLTSSTGRTLPSTNTRGTATSTSTSGVAFRQETTELQTCSHPSAELIAPVIDVTQDCVQGTAPPALTAGVQANANISRSVHSVQNQPQAAPSTGQTVEESQTNLSMVAPQAGTSFQPPVDPAPRRVTRSNQGERKRTLPPRVRRVPSPLSRRMEIKADSPAGYSSGSDFSNAPENDALDLSRLRHVKFGVPNFNGKGSFSAFRAQFEDLAEASKWPDQLSAVYLMTTCLQGSAAIAASALSKEVRRSAKLLLDSLASRFGDQENVETYKQRLSVPQATDEDIQTYADRLEECAIAAYRDQDRSTYEEILLGHFTRGLRNRKLAGDLHLLFPKTLRDAKAKAIHLEVHRSDFYKEPKPVSTTAKLPSSSASTGATRESLSNISSTEEINLYGDTRGRYGSNDRRLPPMSPRTYNRSQAPWLYQQPQNQSYQRPATPKRPLSPARQQQPPSGADGTYLYPPAGYNTSQNAVKPYQSPRKKQSPGQVVNIPQANNANMPPIHVHLGDFMRQANAAPSGERSQPAPQDRYPRCNRCGDYYHVGDCYYRDTNGMEPQPPYFNGDPWVQRPPFRGGRGRPFSRGPNRFTRWRRVYRGTSGLRSMAEDFQSNGSPNATEEILCVNGEYYEPVPEQAAIEAPPDQQTGDTNTPLNFKGELENL